MDRDRAAHRIAAIAGFREEAARLERMGLLRLDAATRTAIRDYHEEVLADVSGDGTSLSDKAGAAAPHWGLRLAAAGGTIVLVALALAGLDLLWPEMADWARIATAIALPLLALLLAEALRAAGRDPAFVALLGALAAGLFWLDLRPVAAVFNRPAGLEQAVAAGAFAAALGHRYRSAWLAFAGLLIGGAGLAALIALADGRLWPALAGRVESALAVGLALFAAGISARVDGAMRPAWRLAGLLFAGGALIALSHPGTSLLPIAPGTAAALYQAAALALLLAALVAALLRGWRESAYGALLLLVVFLLDRLNAWFAPVLPEALQSLMLIAAAALFAWLATLVRRLLGDRRAEEPR